MGQLASYNNFSLLLNKLKAESTKLLFIICSKLQSAIAKRRLSIFSALITRFDTSTNASETRTPLLRNTLKMLVITMPSSTNAEQFFTKILSIRVHVLLSSWV